MLYSRRLKEPAVHRIRSARAEAGVLLARLGPAPRTLLLLLLAAAIPVFLFGGSVFYVIAEQERSAARRRAWDTVTRVAERVSAEIESQIRVAETLAVSMELDAPSLDRFYEEAKRLKAVQPLWETIELTDPAGTQVLNLLRPLGVPLGLTADRDSLNEVVSTRRPVVGGIGPIGPISGRRLVSFRVPVTRGDELKFVLAVLFVPNAVSSILKSAGAPDDWVGAVVDANGNIIARTLAEEFELGQPASPGLREAIARAPQGTYLAYTLEGVEVETVYQSLPGTGGWSVHFGVSREALNAPVSRSLIVLAGGGLASLALALGLAFMTARDVAQRRRDEDARAALALRVSEERGAVAVEAAELGTWRWDSERDEVAGSERCRALFGLPSSRRIKGDAVWSSRQFLEAIHPDDRTMFEAAVRQCLDTGAPVNIDFRALRDGQSSWMRATGRVPKLDGEPHQVVHGVIADVEPQVRAEAERRRLLRRLAEAQENEQRRIARELHDQVGQTVTGLSLGLKRLERALGQEPAGGELKEQVRHLASLTSEIGRDIHRAAADLRPTALDDLGLVRALEALASDWTDRFGVAVDVHVAGASDRLAPEVETVIYRIMQEALTNVAKHSSAKNVSILVEQQQETLRLVIEDDGVGFDPDAALGLDTDESGRVRPRLGLSGIQERLAMINGSMSIESAPGAGTTLFIQIPIHSRNGW
jgi:two-component system, NarL family, sensor histidine kinase UhpB